MASKKLPLAEKEEEEPLLKKGKKAAKPSAKAPIVTRPTTRQTTIPTGVVIKDRVVQLPEATLVVTFVIPTPAAPTTAFPPEQSRRKMHRFYKETDFLGTSS